MITISCVWVQGNVPYTVDYVERLRLMVKRHLTRDHRFVCFTDKPKEVLACGKGIEVFSVPTPRDMPGWWAKLHVFNPEALKGRIINFDLDVLLIKNIDAIADFPAPFALIPHAGNFKGRNGLRVIPRYNSSVMVWDRKCIVHDTIWECWDPKEAAKEFWGDQDFIASVCPAEQTMPIEWFPRLSEILLEGEDKPNWPDQAKVILCKKPKNHEAVKYFPWFEEMWR